MNIAGVVVLYNTDDEIIENVKTYLPILKKLYVADNSTESIDKNIIKFFESEQKIEYIKMNGNEGIAKALKVGTEKAITEGFDYILTMDQDSKYPTEDFKYIEEYIKEEDVTNTGIIAINYTASDYEVLNDNKKYVEKINLAISSGMIIFLDKYQKVEGFNSDLFIDCVDYDICLQMLNKNFDVLLFRNIILNHKLGEPEKRKFLFLERTKPWHSKLRYYYFFRNYHYLKRYKKHFKNVDNLKKQFSLRSIIYLTLFSKERISTLKMILRGIKDGKKGFLGPYQEKRNIKQKKGEKL